MKLTVFLDQPFSYLTSVKSKWFYITTATLFIHFFLILFQPFGVFNIIRDPEKSVFDKFIFFFSISVVSFVGLTLSQFFIRKIFKIQSLTNKRYGFFFLLECFLVFLALFIQFFLISDFDGRQDLAFKISFQLQNFFRIVLILVLPFSITIIYQFIHQLQEEVKEMSLELQRYRNQFPKSNSHQWFEILDENGQQQLQLSVQHFLYAESSNQYVIIYFLKKGVVKREIIRNRLKNIIATNTIPSIKQCHRSYIINLLNVNYMEQNNKKHYLVIEKANELLRIPVSKTYADAIIHEIEQ